MSTSTFLVARVVHPIAALLFAAAACGGDRALVSPESDPASTLRNATAQPVVTVADLGALQGGGHVFVAHGINNSGTVVGSAFSPSLSKFIAFSKSSRDVAEALDGALTFPGTDANYINARGDVVGARLSPSTAVVWPQGGSLIEIPEMTVAHAVNNSGVVVGAARLGGAGWWTRRDGFRALGGDFALDINESGEVVGQASGRAAIWSSDGTLGRIPDVPTAGLSTATGINNRGDVVGFIGQHFFSAGFVWSGHQGLMMLETPAGLYSHPEAINNNGEIVGWLTTGGSSGSGTAAMWTASGQLIRLGGLIPGVPSQAFAINEHGEIVGVSGLADGGATAVLWTVHR